MFVQILIIYTTSFYVLVFCITVHKVQLYLLLFMTRFYERVFVATNFIVITGGSGRTQKGATLYLFTSSLETGMLTILQTNCLKNTIIRTLLLFILNGVVSVIFCSDFTLGRHREVLSTFHATGGLAVCLPIAIEAFPIYLKIWYDPDRDEITCHTWRGNSSIRFFPLHIKLREVHNISHSICVQACDTRTDYASVVQMWML